MKVTIARNIGFCPGAKHAMKTALKLANQGEKVYAYCQLVHNQDALAMLDKARVISIEDITQVPRGSILISNAHGIPRWLEENAQARAIRIIDCTCSHITNIRDEILSRLRQSLTVLIIGDEGHEEIRALSSLSPDCHTITSMEQHSNIEGEKVAIAAQTSLEPEEFDHFIKQAKSRFASVLVIQSLCPWIQKRRDELRINAPQNDAVLIIGSANSANANSLLRTARRYNPRSFLIQSADTIDKDKIQGIESLFVASATSTPDQTVSSLLEFLRAFN